MQAALSTRRARAYFPANSTERICKTFRQGGSSIISSNVTVSMQRASGTTRGVSGVNAVRSVLGGIRLRIAEAAASATAEVSEPPRPGAWEIVAFVADAWFWRRWSTLPAAISARIFRHRKCFDAGFGVGGIGFEGDLPSRCSFTASRADVFFNAIAMRPMVTLRFVGGLNHVHFARIGLFLHFVRQRDQAVGFTRLMADTTTTMSCRFGAGFGEHTLLDQVFYCVPGEACGCAAVFMYD